MQVSFAQMLFDENFLFNRIYISFVESHEVFVAEIGQPNSGRLFSLKFSRPGPIRAFLAPHDVILLLYKDSLLIKKKNPNK